MNEVFVYYTFQTHAFPDKTGGLGYERYKNTQIVN